MPKFERRYVITAADMDSDYHITPNAVLLYLQDTIAFFLSCHRMAAFDVIDDGLLWVVSDYNVKLDPEARPYWPDEVTVSLWVSEISPIRMHFDFRMTDSKGTEFSCGSSCWAIINAVTRKPMEEADSYLGSMFEVIPEYALGRRSKVIFPALAADSGPKGAFDYVTSMPDVDFNGHVSNRQYTAAALSCESLDFERSHTIKSIRIKYIKETLLGDTLHCSMYVIPGENMEEEHLYRIMNDAGDEVCRVAIAWIPQPVLPFAVREKFPR